MMFGIVWGAQGSTRDKFSRKVVVTQKSPSHPFSNFAPYLAPAPISRSTTHPSHIRAPKFRSIAYPVHNMRCSAATRRGGAPAAAPPRPGRLAMRLAAAAAQRRTAVRAAAATPRPLLLDNYDSYSYNLYQILAEVYGGARPPPPLTTRAARSAVVLFTPLTHAHNPPPQTHAR